MLSIIVPAYKEPYLQRTVDEILLNAERNIEVIVVLDGYWASPTLKDDPRVRILHFGENRGLRAGINAGIALSKGEYVMCIDAHCIIGKGFDRILIADHEEGNIYVPRRYELDVEKWEVMSNPPVDYEKLIIHKIHNKFHGERWRSRDALMKDFPVDETMGFQGSCWLMSRKHWNTIGEMQEEGYGKFTQIPTEIGFKTLKSGGKVMVNKKTWYAHRHKDFKRTHKISQKEIEAGNQYAMKIWADEYEKLKVRFGV